MENANGQSRDWNEVKANLKQQFVLLSDADMLREDGKENEFYARLQAKLGKTRAEVQSLIASL